MKTTDPRDPLDQTIDELLTSQPVKAPEDFAARTLDKVDAQPQRKKSGSLAPLIRFALPLAAALALAFIVFDQFSPVSPEAPTGANGLSASNTDPDEDLSSYEVQELLLLQEGLSGFAQTESDKFNSDELLHTLETLYSI